MVECRRIFAQLTNNLHFPLFCSILPLWAFENRLSQGTQVNYIFQYGDYLMAFEDKTLVCKECGKEFTFTAGEQEFYAEKGFENEPARCRDCRDKRRRSRDGGEQRQMFKVTCADCGKETEVPFQPRGDKPVYCRECFQAQQAARF